MKPGEERYTQAEKGTCRQRKAVRVPVLPAPVISAPGTLGTGEDPAFSATGTLGTGEDSSHVICW